MLNYEDQKLHKVKVIVHDSGVPSMDVVLQVDVHVTNGNDPPRNIQISSK